MSVSSTAGSADTVLDRLLADVRRKDVALDGQERAAAILWPDPESEWLPLQGILCERAPELLTVGDYDAAKRIGPAIWIRCVVDGTLGAVGPAGTPGAIPIVYLPGASRQVLRSGDECPDAWKPFVELMHRGTLWLQPSGVEWTVLAFLTSSRALGLDVARDRETLEALRRALPEIALTPVAQLEGRRLGADDFDRMLADDVPRDLLRWMCAPDATKARFGPERWAAFRSRCRAELRGFDPEQEPDVAAGQKLAFGEGPWGAVWRRFSESPRSFAEIARVLERSKPDGVLPFDTTRWPHLNDAAEGDLREELAHLVDLPHDRACEKVLALENAHKERRSSVWADLGRAPLAVALEPLARLATGARASLGGTTPDDIAAAYTEGLGQTAGAWLADAAAWEALALRLPGVEQVVAGAVRHLLGPWLDASARAFQDACERRPLPVRGQHETVRAEDDTCIVFVDGLRYDIARRLSQRLEGRGCRVRVAHRWAALPTVTATAKPAVTPVADAVAADSLGGDFGAMLGSRAADAPTLRDAMSKCGYQILGEGALDVPMTRPARGWLELGQIDTLGHKLQLKLARQVPEELDRLAEKVVELLDSGWRKVRIVTDHGWLLLPGGLPKSDLPKYVTESRWSRCAVISPGATPKVRRTAWYWNPTESFATAPGIHCFNASPEYAHGGLSIQECLTPDLAVERGEEAVVAASITTVTWRGLRCFVEAVVRGTVVADIRLERAAGTSVAKAPKELDADGTVSLVLSGDEHEEANLVLALLDETGRILAQRTTRVGKQS